MDSSGSDEPGGPAAGSTTKTVIITPETGHPIVVNLHPVPAGFEFIGTDGDQTKAIQIGRERRKLYRSMAVLGRGAEGEVRLVECLDTPDKQLAAMKMVSKSLFAAPHLKIRLQAARSVSRLFGLAWRCNSHLPKNIDAFETKKSVVLVWELLACPLQTYIARQGARLNETDATIVLTGVLSALSTLHSLDILHRDVKPANLMLRDADDLSSVCLVDFASSIRREWVGKLYQENENRSTNSLAAGTPLYMAPDVCQGQLPSQKDDIWSVGCIAYEILYGKHPFEGAESMLDLTNRIVEGKLNTPPEEMQISDLANDFIARLLTVNAAARPTVDEALKHPWLAPAVKTDVYHANRKPVGRPLYQPETAAEGLESFPESPPRSPIIANIEQPKPPTLPKTKSFLQNLLPPFAQFSETFVDMPNHGFAVTGAEVVFDPVTGELRVLAGKAPSFGWDEDDEDDDV